MTNIATDQINQAKTLLDSAQSICIATGSNPSIDSLGAALSLYLSLSSLGKQVIIACPDQPRVEFSHLVGVDKLTNNLTSGGGGKNLVVSFPYQEGSIEKVSYNIDNDLFNLVIEPRENYPQVTPDSIKYSYSGGKIDLIITISTTRLDNLNFIYQNNKDLFNQKPIINIDNQNQNSRYGKVNIIDNSVSSVSELAISAFSMLGLNLNPDIASNLYAGIVSGSQNFTSSTTSVTTFEAATICLRNGAKILQPTTQPNQANSAYFSPPIPFPKTQKQPSFSPQGPKPQRQQFVQKQPQRISNPPFQPSPKVQPHQEAPPDWLKPKIFKGSTLL